MKQQKILMLIYSFLFLSCSSIRFKEQEIDQTQALKGSIKEMKIKKEYFNFRLDLKEKDTVSMMEEFTFVYAKNNKPKKQIEQNPKGEVENIFSYNKDGTLKNEIVKYPQYVSRQEYKYDKKKNNFEYLQFENDSLIIRKTKKFDSNNNPIEITFFNSKNTKSNSRVTFSYDYKARFAIYKMYDYNNKEKDRYLKYNYDRRGNIIKIETINYNSKNPYPYYSIREYDDYDNLIKLIIVEYGGSRTINFINKYDRIGNIVTREKFSDGKLYMKVSYQIIYY